MAKSSWVAAVGGCDLPAFEQRFHISAVVGGPTTVHLEEDTTSDMSEWLGDCGNHVAVLSLAWAYVLSARWSNLVDRATPMAYTDVRAVWEAAGTGGDAQSLIVGLGVVTAEAARWWTAVLAPGQGWQASIPHPRWPLLSPWTVNLDSEMLTLRSQPPIPRISFDIESPPSFETAVPYINDYCAFHATGDGAAIATQRRAALAAALLLPLANLDGRSVSFLQPWASPAARKRHILLLPPQGPIWGHETQQLDRLLTLSCNAFGTRALLGSVFFEPDVPSNVCGAWLQASFAALRPYVEKPRILASMFFARRPQIAFLWLGGILTGAHRFFLRKQHDLLGLNRIDLHEAAWTGTLLSFIQEPVSPLPPGAIELSRSDECKLMFLAQRSTLKDHPPIYPYPSLGLTSIDDTDLDVRAHVLCNGQHGLRYAKITWSLADAGVVVQEAREISIVGRDHRVRSSGTPIDASADVDFGGLNRERDLSEGVARNIFTWMREIDGYPIAERNIYQHEWIDAFDDDDDDESLHPEGDGTSTAGRDIPVRVGSWLVNAATSRSYSI